LKKLKVIKKRERKKRRKLRKNKKSRQMGWWQKERMNNQKRKIIKNEYCLKIEITSFINFIILIFMKFRKLFYYFI